MQVHRKLVVLGFDIKFNLCAELFLLHMLIRVLSIRQGWKPTCTMLIVVWWGALLQATAAGAS